MTPKRAKYYAEKYLMERIDFWSSKLEEIDTGVFYTEEEKSEFYHTYMFYKNELAELDVDLGNLTEEGHW